jgi:hypothetical protein
MGITTRLGKKKNGSRAHLFNSFVLHILLLAYLLSLPVYRGNISLRELGSYFVYLKSEEGTEAFLSRV